MKFKKIIMLFLVSSGFVAKTSFTQSNVLVINEIMSANITSIHDEYEVDMQNCPVPDCAWWYERMGRSTHDGDYPDWIEITHTGTNPIDLTGYGLSDDPSEPYKWIFPHIDLSPGEYLLVFASGKDRKEPGDVEVYMHTNFKIDRKGETITLTDDSGIPCDEVDTGEIPIDFSLGRYPDGGTEWVVFSKPTPAEKNTTPPFPGYTDSIQTSHHGGFYSNGLSLSLSASSSTAEIRYALEGNDPSPNSNLYINPISINNTTVVKARSFENNNLSSKILTQTFFINKNFTMPVISLSTIPDNLWDGNTGIYVPGNNADENNRIANYWQDWERPAYLEFYEPDGSLGFSINIGLKIFGWGSRKNDLKSLSIMMRDRYGQNKINYRLFPDLPITEFRSFVLRAAGGDWQRTFFRDPFASGLVKDRNLDMQAFHPTIVFINGEYWGIHNIREKLNEDYLASHHHIDRDNVDIISRYWRRTYPVIIEGDDQAYLALENYLKSHHLSDPNNYEYIKTLIDIDNYLDYCVSQIYCANYDWPGNNSKCWRARTPVGKWRWLMFDLDYTFNSDGVNNYRHNTLIHATNPYGTGWPNPDFTTFLLRKMLESESFRIDFINRFGDLMNTVFVEDTVLKKIDEMKAIFEPEMQRHINKWGSYEYTLRSMADWGNNIEVLREFAAHRKSYVCNHICDKFDVKGWEEIELNVSQPIGGKIKINSIIIEKYPWTGDYFLENPIQVSALPKPGYRFIHWAGFTSGDSLAPTMTINLTQPLSLTAYFEKESTSLPTMLINEINYNSSPDFNPEDWIELYNPQCNPVDISGWIFKDGEDAHEFIIPNNTIISADHYFILCRNSTKFHNLFPDRQNYIGDFNFGLNRQGELIRLFNNQNLIIDSLTYGNITPWPTEPDGNGSTLSLHSAYLDNSVPQSWGSSLGYGTPGRVNDLLTTDLINKKLSTSTDFYLSQNYPNPFNPQTHISYQLPKLAQVQIEVYNLKGQKIRTLVDTEQSMNNYTISWNGTDAFGGKVANGIYIYRIKAITSQQTLIMSKKMIVLK